MSNTASTQDRRLIRLSTVLGEKALIVEDVEGEESMSDGFSYTVDVFSETEHDLSAEDLVGTAADLNIVQEDNSLRTLNGYIQSLEAKGSGRVGQRSFYRLTMVSWLELLLDSRSDCRIFQEKTVAQILGALFKGYGEAAKIKLELTQAHPVRRFRVQYNETDLSFFKRLCQSEGLAYYFIHSQGEHRLHIIDSGTPLVTLGEKVMLQSSTLDHDHLTEWKSCGQFATGHYTQRSYNYMSPNKDLTSRGQVSAKLSQVARVTEQESYRYGEGYHDEGEGKLDTQHRVDQGSVRRRLREGSGHCRQLSVGQQIQIELATGAAFADQGESFTLTKMDFNASNAGGGFNCDVEAVVKGELVYPEVAPEDVQHLHLQTAVVTGPSGEEVHCDPYGRIKVQFHWDRIGTKDEDSSCWLRVMQSFAGPGFGSQFTPRIGQEVVVAFENGNPDRPFVMGALYHPEHLPPYGEQQGSRSGIRTRSTKGGAASQCNELYFEDKKDEEEVYFQAERDHNSVIKNDETRSIGNDLTVEVTNDETHSVGNDLNRTVTNNELHNVGNDVEIIVGNDKTETISNMSSQNIGTELVIEAGLRIVLQVGASKIEITPASIIISSPLVEMPMGPPVVGSPPPPPEPPPPPPPPPPQPPEEL